ncbi:MAG: hypothetical protein P1U38_00135 [Aeromicrobium sp.]|uniref:hypothetical protein n=1 Tax=Aeromicrobium sp. TaxID=1871063 RepID=UPI00260DFABD|nr:hypothetical protein [Aeromicrobium sp.]MDF1703160.1 hypothetical protein [Aeromicrobium sp.]
MNDPVAYAVAGLAVVAAVYAGWLMWRDEAFTNGLFYVMIVLELVLLALLVGGSIALARTERDVDGVLFISYLVTVVVIPPAAVIWGVAEKSRWGTGVVLVAMLTIAVLVVRVLGIWQGAYV